MKNKLLSVITEGGRVFGFGHITRSLSIAKIFEQYKYEVEFIVYGDDSISSILKGTSHTVFNWIENSEKLLKEISNSTIILIDSMSISNIQLLRLEKTNIPVIYIDDEKRRNILNSGFVVDWTVLSDKKKHFNHKNGVTYLLGSRYTPLRDEFKKAKKNLIKDNIESVMVTFGGADIRNLTPVVLQTLITYFPDVEKNIIVGKAFANIDKIITYKDKNTNLIFDADAKSMIGMMQTNDLAIASGGQTLYELARIGTPTIAILLVDNAKDDTNGWGEVGSIKNIGWYDSENLLTELIRSINYLKKKHKRIEMQNNAAKYINPNGSRLLVDEIIKRLKG